MSAKYSVGGRGYTHAVVNYRRVLAEGLDAYRARIVALEGRATDDDRRAFYAGCREALDGLLLFHEKSLAYLRSLPLTPELEALTNALAIVPRQPARTFYEAMVCANYVWYLDGGDSIGRFDQHLSPFYERDVREGRIDAAKATALLTAFWKSFDAMSGWNMILGGTDERGEISYTPFTEVCVRSLGHARRPNAGIRIRPDMPREMWDAVLDSLAAGSGNPALYNEPAYLASIPERTGVTGPDRYTFAFGGCTELMFDGRSNVGSTECGVNMVEVLDATIRKYLAASATYEEFLGYFTCDLRRSIDEMMREVNLNQEYKALYRPQPVRTLLMDDCIDRGLDFHAGGARYNGSTVNAAGLANVANSLFTIGCCFDGTLGISAKQLAELLASNFEGDGVVLNRIRGLTKYGNNRREVDEIANAIAETAFSAIASHRTWRGNGFCAPACIMFTTFTEEGRNIGATPDGRLRSSPIADSIGPMQGTDREGPTSMLQSVASLPQAKGIGTLVLNLRLPRSVFESRDSREKLISLIQTYFEKGGLQVQVTVVDVATLKKAMEHPEEYESLIVRIGGYTEYFNRLPMELKLEVLKRTAHEV
jgi:formate C-acetyltransferase